MLRQVFNKIFKKDVEVVSVEKVNYNRPYAILLQRTEDSDIIEKCIKICGNPKENPIFIKLDELKKQGKIHNFFVKYLDN